MFRSLRNKILVTFFLSFLCNVLFSQERNLVEEMAGNYIQIRQKPDTELLLKEWLNDFSMADDTVYAILYVPMDCPRCEVAIPNFWEKLKAIDANKKMWLITAYSDSLLAKEYNKSKGYVADVYIYDTSERYKQIFNTNISGGLMGLHILKIDKKKGNLLMGGQYTVLNNMFVKQLIDYKDMLEKSTLSNNDIGDKKNFTETPKEIPLLSSYKDYALESHIRVSSIFDTPRFIEDNLFFTDVLQNGVMLFKYERNCMKYKGLLQADSLEKMCFLKVPERIYKHFDAHKMLFYIALGTNVIDDKHIGISYSIPKAMSDGEENSYGLYNAPVIISRDIETMAPDSMLTLDFDIENDTVFFNTHFSFSMYMDKIIIGCKKLTWPMEYEREEYEKMPAMNPFCPQFYDTENPFIAAFNSLDGKLYKRYGNLDIAQASSRTGYYFTKPIAASYSDELIYTDGYSGKVTILADEGRKEQTFFVFNIDTHEFPQPDSAFFYTYDYAKSYTKFFNRCITDVKFDERFIYTITKYAKPDSDEGARYVYTIINRKNGKTLKRTIPQISGNVIGCGLRTKKQKVSPFILFKNGPIAIVRIFDTKGIPK